MVRARLISWPEAMSEVDEAASSLICMDFGTATMRWKSVRGEGEEVVATSLICDLAQRHIIDLIKSLLNYLYHHELTSCGKLSTCAIS